MKYRQARPYQVECTYRKKEDGPVILEQRKLESFNVDGAERALKTKLRAEGKLLVKVLRVICLKGESNRG